MRKLSYTIYDNYFSKLTLESCYWAGFIAADGCIMNKKQSQKVLSIQLHVKDESLLEKLRVTLQYTGKLYFYQTKTTPTCTLSVRSDKLCNDLEKNFNITPRKSLTLKPPEGLTKQQELAYIIGYIDGDGCISITDTKYSYMHLIIIGTEIMVKWIHEKLKILTNKPFKRIPLTKRNKVFQYNIGGTKANDICSKLDKIDVPKL